MHKYLSGAKTVIVKNIPGAGHIIGANTIFKSKANGLTFGTLNRTLGLTQVAGLKGVRFDLTKMGWFGSASIEPMTFVVGSNGGIKNIDDVIKAEKPVKGYENVPLIQIMVRDKKYQPVIDLLFTVSLLGRPFADPPDIPPIV